MVYHKGDDPISRLNQDGFYRHRIVAVVTIVLILGVFLTRLPQTEAYFVIAEWDYPDEHGQGIYDFDVYENSTGSWQNVGGPTEYDESGVFEWEAGVSIKLKAWSYFNSTLSEATTTNEGKLYQRHTVTVILLGNTVFSQQNFTYSNVDTSEAPMWVYSYDVILNFIPAAGAIYTVTVTYEVFW
jgi:hypothetical protein